MDGAVTGMDVYGIDALLALDACCFASASSPRLFCAIEVGDRCDVVFVDGVVTHGLVNCGGPGYGMWSNASEPRWRCCVSTAIVIAIDIQLYFLAR